MNSVTAVKPVIEEVSKVLPVILLRSLLPIRSSIYYEQVETQRYEFSAAQLLPHSSPYMCLG